MYRITLRARWPSMLSVLVLLAALPTTQGWARVVDIGVPPGHFGSGSFSSSPGTPESRAGIVFDVHQTFSISSVGLAARLDGALSIEVHIFEVDPIPFPAPLDPDTLTRTLVRDHPIRAARGSLVASTTMEAVAVEPFNFHKRQGRRGGPVTFWWFDVPLDFTFVAGNRYEIYFPDVFITAGTPENPNNWFFFDVLYDDEAGAFNKPYTVLDVLTVLSGALLGDELVTVFPWVRLDTDLPSLSGALLKCQRTIGRAGHLFLRRILDIRRKCLEDQLREKISPGTDCRAQPLIVDDRTTTALARAEEKLQNSLDRACRSVNLEELGFPGLCPDAAGPPFTVFDLQQCVQETHEDKARQLINVEFPP